VPGNVAALDRPSGPLTSLEPSASSARGSAESVSGNQPEAGADPASLRVAAWPWAEVRIDDAPALVTPHADPFSLAPGHHLVRFDHPTFGHAEVEVDLAPGERRLVRHVFDGAPPP